MVKLYQSKIKVEITAIMAASQLLPAMLKKD